MPKTHMHHTAIVLVLSAAFLGYPLRGWSEQTKQRTPSRACLEAAAAKELGAAARERFLASCDPAPSSEANAQAANEEFATKPKLNAEEKSRVAYCTSIAAGRSLSGGSRDHFLRDCLSGY